MWWCMAHVLQGVAIQSGNVVDLLRAKLHKACSGFYAAVHEGNMHGMGKSVGTCTDKCARLKDNVLQHVGDLNRSGMVGQALARSGSKITPPWCHSNSNSHARKQPCHPHDFHIAPSVCRSLCQRWGSPTVDIFASGERSIRVPGISLYKARLAV